MTRHLLPLTLIGALAACTAPAPLASPSVAAVPSAPAWIEWLTAADARPSAAELAARAAESTVARRARALALARLGDTDASRALIEGLRDPDVSVRSASAMGLGGLETEAPPAAAVALLTALAAEVDPAARGEILFDAGRTGTELVWPALNDGLASESAFVRRGACRGIGGAGLSSAAVPEGTLSRAASRAADDPDVLVRLFCAHAVGRSSSVPETALADLGRAAVDPDARVRALALRALGRNAATALDTLVRGTSDPDPFVALAALRALASRVDGAGAYAARIDDLTTAFTAGREDAWTPALLAALGAPSAEVASTEELRASATRAHDTLGRVAPDTPATRDRAMLHCAAARLADLGDRALSRVPGCGLGLVAEDDRQVLAAEVLGALPTSSPADVAELVRLAGDESVRVREAVAAALAAIDLTDAVATLRMLVTDADPGVRIAAVEAIGAHLGRERAALDAAAVEALLSGTPAPVVPRILDDALGAALTAALERFVEADDLEGLVTVAGVLERAREPTLARPLSALLSHHNITVRRRARAALDACDIVVEPFGGVRATPPSPRRAEDLALDARFARISTDRGTIVLELWPDVAPTTVARFVELADARTFDGLTFHRVVPGFVAQGGDPRGDGYGGPGWSQRCEDSRATYERGTLGMALAGRDTGGSQFFIAITPQPHLDGRYTAFGRVVEGMDIVDRLLPGDVMRTVRVERGAPAEAPALRPTDARL